MNMSVAQKRACCAVEYLISDEGFNTEAAKHDTFSRTLQIVRRNTLPFGGIKVVIPGDPMQNTPIVADANQESRMLCNLDFAQCSEELIRLDPAVILLTKSERADGAFARMLCHMGLGLYTAFVVAVLSHCVVSSRAVLSLCLYSVHE